MGDDAKAGLGLERRPHPIVPEPHALELRPIVLQREIGMAGRRDRDPPDLALDPQVAQLVVGPNRGRDGARGLADGQDPGTDLGRAGGSDDRIHEANRTARRAPTVAATGQPQVIGCASGWASAWSAADSPSGVATSIVFGIVPCGPSDVWSTSSSAVVR